MGQRHGSLSADERAELGRQKAAAKLERDASHAIDKNMSKAKKQYEREIKLLLLGPGEAGKSTILKQLRILHGGGFSKHGATELPHWTNVVYNNIIEGFKFIVQNTDRFADPALNDAVDTVDAWPAREAATMNPEMAALAVSFWEDAGVQAMWAARSKFPAVLESLDYFMANIDRIAQRDYAASDADVLHTRVRTTGVTTEKLNINGVPFSVVDVGGQRSERHKWLSLFSDTTAVVFLVALSEYDQFLFEDNTALRMEEALIVWADIANNEHLRNSTLVLFFNKSDLFAEKLRRVPFRVDEGPHARFTSYEGPAFDFSGAQEVPPIGSREFMAVYDGTLKYLRDTFLNRVEDRRRKVRARVTCAMDTEKLDVLFQTLMRVILDQYFDI